MDICFPSWESNFTPIFSRSLHTQAAMVGDEFPRSSFVAAFIRCQSLHPVGMPKSHHLCRMSIPTNLVNPGALICQVSQTMPRPESSREPIAATVPQAWSPCSMEPAPLPVPFFGFLSLPRVGLLWSQSGSLGSTDIPFYDT